MSSWGSLFPGLKLPDVVANALLKDRPALLCNADGNATSCHTRRRSHGYIRELFGLWG